MKLLYKNCNSLMKLSALIVSISLSQGLHASTVEQQTVVDPTTQATELQVSSDSVASVEELSPVEMLTGADESSLTEQPVFKKKLSKRARRAQAHRLAREAHAIAKAKRAEADHQAMQTMQSTEFNLTQLDKQAEAAEQTSQAIHTKIEKKLSRAERHWMRKQAQRAAKQARIDAKAQKAEQAQLAKQARIDAKVKAAEQAQLAKQARIYAKVKAKEQARLAKQARIEAKVKHAEQRRLAKRAKHHKGKHAKVAIQSQPQVAQTKPVLPQALRKQAKPATAAKQEISVEDVKRFSRAISHIKKYYVKSTEDKALFENAIRGMMEGLDPHSTYLDKDAFSELRQTTSGEFSGVGIEVTMDKGVIKVITPIDGTPAFKAGLKPGDYIVKIDDTAVKGLSLRQAVSKMRGRTGTKVKLIVVREGAKRPLHFNIVRKKVKVQSVRSRMLDGNYGYVRITQFQKFSARDLIRAITQLNKKAGGKINGLVLDLRNNPGGLLDSAIQVSDAFIHNDQKGEEEVIVYTKGRVPGSDFAAFAKPGDILHNAPIVVLINSGSASASEIVAGALKDNKRAILLGTRSFGKGSVQTILPLDDKRGIKLTTALYYTPAGASIQAKGITPDILVKNLKVTKKENEDKGVAFSESHLQGHIETKDGQLKNADGNSKAKTKKQGDLVYTDYQLYQALNLLKGISAMND